MFHHISKIASWMNSCIIISSNFAVFIDVHNSNLSFYNNDLMIIRCCNVENHHDLKVKWRHYVLEMR
jgi:hypothetical protein